MEPDRQTQGFDAYWDNNNDALLPVPPIVESPIIPANLYEDISHYVPRWFITDNDGQMPGSPWAGTAFWEADGYPLLPAWSPHPPLGSLPLESQPVPDLNCLQLDPEGSQVHTVVSSSAAVSPNSDETNSPQHIVKDQSSPPPLPTTTGDSPRPDNSLAEVTVATTSPPPPVPAKHPKKRQQRRGLRKIIPLTSADHGGCSSSTIMPAAAVAGRSSIVSSPRSSSSPDSCSCPSASRSGSSNSSSSGGGSGRRSPEERATRTAAAAVNTTTTTTTAAKRNARASHNEVEKKYRSRLNGQFDILIDTLGLDQADDGLVDPDSCSPRLHSKAEVLAMATRRIRLLEREIKSQGDEVGRLRDDLRRARDAGLPPYPPADMAAAAAAAAVAAPLWGSG